MTKLGAAAVIFTVDTAWKSKRTRDVRAKTTVQVSLTPPLPSSSQICTPLLNPFQAPIKQTGEGSARSSASPLGVSQAISGYQDTNLTWSDIDFIRVNHGVIPL